MTPRIVAHRGSSLRYRENTVAAFVGAFDEGADGLELDVRRSVDGVIVVHHDPHLSDGRLISKTLAENLPAEVPALGLVLEQFSSMWLNVEIKNDRDEPGYDESGELARAVVDEVLRRAPVEGAADVVISSFDDLTLRQATAALDPSARAQPTGLLTFGFLVWRDPAAEDGDDVGFMARSLNAAIDMGCAAINPHDSLVTPRLVADAHDRNLEVNVWTVDEPDRIVELAAMGVDGIITNDPAGALAAVSQ